jgi:hypothetical protein
VLGESAEVLSEGSTGLLRRHYSEQLRSPEEPDGQVSCACIYVSVEMDARQGVFRLFSRAAALPLRTVFWPLGFVAEQLSSSMLGSLNRAIGGKSKYEKVTTLDEPMGVFAIEEDDDIERISQLHRDLVTQAQAELQESEERVGQLLSERQSHARAVHAILKEPTPTASGPRRRYCCGKTCAIL